MERAVFLDRDGTIDRDLGYVSRPEDLEILPGVPQAIAMLNQKGFKVVVITNQSGLARGYFTEQTLAEMHEKMKKELAQEGAGIDAIYYCPHHPDEGCECRKPKPALILRAAEELGIDCRLSYMIGDAEKDLFAGKAAGCKTILVTTGPNQGQDVKVAPDYTAETLQDAALWIINQSGDD